MLTVETAKQLCILAHEGQFRKGPIALPESYIDEWNTLMQTVDIQSDEDIEEFHVLSDGSKAYYDYYNNKKLVMLLPYHTHPIAVANLLETDDERIVGYLHDVCEDCDGWGLGRVMDNSRFWVKDRNTYTEYPITAIIYWALMLLTHNKDIPYTKYITSLTQCKEVPELIQKEVKTLVLKVKLADMFHNMSYNPSDKQKEKYMRALNTLLVVL